MSKGPEAAPVNLGKKTYSVERFAVGVSVSVLGFSWLVAWIYFMVTGWESFATQFDALILHVALQFVSAVGLMLSGFAIFGQWRKFRGIYLSSMALLVLSIGVAIVSYGPTGPVSLFLCIFLLFGHWWWVEYLRLQSTFLIVL